MVAVLADLVALDPRRGPGLSADLTAQLRALIVRGRLAPGAMLPSSRRFAQDLGVSRNTVMAAWDQLAAEGYLVVRQGCRPVVAAQDGPAPGSVKGGVDLPESPSLPLALSTWAAALPAAPPEAGLLPFRTGFSDAREFPHAAWARCLREAGRLPPTDPPFVANSPALQAALLDHLAAARGVRAAADQVVILPTARAALALVAAILLDPGDEAWIEDPGYPGSRAALRAVRARIRPVPVDAGGLTLPEDGARPKLVVTTPSHQFPTGSLMPLSRRRGLLRLAAAAGAVVVEDDYDGEFHFDGAPVPALQALDEAGCVVYAGTFSKATLPAIRIGTMVVPRPLLAPVLAAQRQVGLFAASPVQDALALFLRRGHYRAHVRRMRRLYRERRDRLVAALREHCADRLDVAAPAGGLQLLATLRDGSDDVAVAARATRCGLDVLPLSRLYAGPADRTGLLLGFASCRPQELAAAAVRLAEALGAEDEDLGPGGTAL
ncbi:MULTISPECIES: MocR-like pyridoxine biosynthesis transcription factor PdxR [Methylobacterium]|uniref:MocR-like pyridoxine biosynthesis transcription factor PdxR n=1 Tax=Methylobacterium TaxID=407 RepID=UPI0013EB346B|nr:PLP-dependent aminotransferase family protein [Methylobacterium sp. DB0501]NGM34431.1 PLP-dependent aminotransferase family protein [Methylobacterium sp. DB0501]